MARVASRTQSIVLGSSIVPVTELIVLVCWTCTACATSICSRDPPPHNAKIWNDNPTDVNVTVVWTVEAVIYTTRNVYCVLTTNSAIAERPRCRVGQFWPKVEDNILQTA